MDLSKVSLKTSQSELALSQISESLLCRYWVYMILYIAQWAKIIQYQKIPVIEFFLFASKLKSTYFEPLRQTNISVSFLD